MPQMRLMTMTVAAWLLITPGARAQENVTENTVQPVPGSTPPRARIADVAWLAGHWTGEGLGGLVEEIWTPPRAGAMLGMFRMVKDGRPALYELFTLSEHDGSLIIRLKHFNPDMTGWEEKAQTVDFPLVAVGNNVVQFSGLTIRRDSPDALTVFLAIGDRSGAQGRPREETFRYRRAARLAQD